MSIINGTAKDLLPGDVAYVGSYEYEILSVKMGRTFAELTVAWTDGPKIVDVPVLEELTAYRKPANATEFRHVTNGDAFQIDRGFGPEFHTATEDAKQSTAHSSGEIWYARTVDSDGQDSYVTATYYTPIRVF